MINRYNLLMGYATCYMEEHRVILIKLFGALNDKTLLDLVTSVVKQTQNVPDIKEWG